MEFVGLEVWADTSKPHRTRGIEHAADVVAWGVDGQQYERCQVRPFGDLATAYEILTGAAPRRTTSTGAVEG